MSEQQPLAISDQHAAGDHFRFHVRKIAVKRNGAIPFEISQRGDSGARPSSKRSPSVTRTPQLTIFAFISRSAPSSGDAAVKAAAALFVGAAVLPCAAGRGQG